MYPDSFAQLRVLLEQTLHMRAEDLEKLTVIELKEMLCLGTSGKREASSRARAACGLPVWHLQQEVPCFSVLW